jgi:hypothetical protein
MTKKSFIYLFTLLFLTSFCANKKDKNSNLNFGEMTVRVCHIVKTIDTKEILNNPWTFTISRSGDDAIMDHALNIKLKLRSDLAIKTAFIDMHKKDDNMTHGIGGHQDGVNHNMPDGFMGRMILGYPNENGSFTLEDNTLILKERKFPEQDTFYGPKAVGVYKIVIGVIDEKNIEKELIFFFEIIK